MNKEEVDKKVAEILESDDLKLEIVLALIEAYSRGYTAAIDRSMQIQAEIFGKGGQPNDNQRS